MHDTIVRFDTAKIVIDWRCNLDCSYCCNKYNYIRDSFTPITMQEIANSHYTDFELTGGEPLLPQAFIKLEDLCVDYIPTGRNIYVYTNGVLLNHYKATLMEQWGVTGLNIGYHNGSGLDWKLLNEVNEYLPIRLRVNKDDVKNIPKDLRIGDIHLWSLGDCDAITTDRFYLEAKGLKT